MAIYTPRGLKIRVSVPYSFGLMARLYPKVTAYKVLKTVEASECIPDVLGLAAVLLAFIIRLEPLQIALVVVGARFLGWCLGRAEAYSIPGLIPLATAYTWVSGFGLLFIATLLIGASCVGWLGVLSYLIGRLSAAILLTIIEFVTGTPYDRVLNRPFTTSEQGFFAAYRFHALRIGASTDVLLSEEEMNEDRWLPVLEEFEAKWPEAVQRFTSDDYML